MGKGRLEAFSDGIFAIIITIAVLEMKVPHTAGIDALRPVVPVFLSYALSFLYLGIYWNNHHHLLHTVKQVTGGILWANMHLLFWLSLFPFVTGWVGENHLASIPMALYGGILFLAAMAYFILQRVIIATQGKESILAKAVGRDFKGKLSPIFYIIAMVLSFWAPLASFLIYVFVALMWLVPDRRIERVLVHKDGDG